MKKRLMSAVLKQKFLSGDENLWVAPALWLALRGPHPEGRAKPGVSKGDPKGTALVERSGTRFETRRLAAPRLSTRAVSSTPRRGGGDLSEQRQNMQLAVEIKLPGLTLGVSDAVPEPANLLDPD
jgi:hypothetical protein